MAEVDHVARRALTPMARDALLDVMGAELTSGRFVSTPVDPTACAAARDVQRRFADLDLDLSDAVSVVIAHRYATTRVLTLDRRDLRVVTPLGGGAFTLLPDDRRPESRSAPA